jgi:hypothetical protein
MGVRTVSGGFDCNKLLGPGTFGEWGSAVPDAPSVSPFVDVIGEVPEPGARSRPGLWPPEKLSKEIYWVSP